MKTKYWVILFAAVLLLCLGLSAGFLTGGETHSFAEISSGGSLVRTVDLRIDQTFTGNPPRCWSRCFWRWQSRWWQWLQWPRSHCSESWVDALR